MKNARKREKAEEALEDEIARAWRRLASGVQVRMLDIPKISRDVKLELAAGTSMDDAILAAVERYRVKE